VSSVTNPSDPNLAVPVKVDVPGEAVPPKNVIVLTNRQKVAVLLAHFGAQLVGPVLKEMSDEEAISFSKEIVSLPAVNNETVVDILAEFMERCSQPDFSGHAGGLSLARTFLEERLGQTRAQEIMDQIEGQQATGPLSGMLRVDPQQALAVLGAQQPQVVAVLLAYLSPEDAAGLLSALEPSFRAKVAKKIAQLNRVDPVAVRHATSLLVGKLRNADSAGSTTVAGGSSVMAEILNHSDRSIEQQVLSEIEKDDQVLAEQIRAKLFTFDDVLKLEDKSLQHIFRRVDAQTLALAMREPSLSADAVARIRANVSERVNAMIEEEREVMGQVRTTQINAAQATIVRVARKLDAEGVIVIARENEIVA
jgi:flagellar motor switch protein FliG